MAEIIPETAKEAIAYIVWGVLVLGFGLETVTAFVHTQWLPFAISVAGLVLMTGAALYSRKVAKWASGLSPGWAVGALMLLLLVAALTPYAEGRRWPLAWLAPGSSPTAEQIAVALSPLIKSELTKEPPQDVLALIASLRSQLESERGILQATQGQLAATKDALDEARKPPLNPEAIPTWLNLSFNDKGEPSETGSTNVHWAWWNPQEVVACPAPTSLPLSALYPITGTTQSADNRVCTADSTLIFLSFDKPVKYDHPFMRTPTDLPKWEASEQTPKGVIIYIHGQITNTSIEIEVAK